MLAAHNERRRARGEAEVTAGEVEARVLRERSEQRRRPWRLSAVGALPDHRLWLPGAVARA